MAGEDGDDETEATDEFEGAGVVAEFVADVAEDHEGAEEDDEGEGEVDLLFAGGVADFGGGFGGDGDFFAESFDHFDDVEGDALGVFPDAVFVGLVVGDAIEEGEAEFIDEFDGFGAGEGI